MRKTGFAMGAVAAGSLLLGGCATIMGGKHQKVSFATTPAGARCSLLQEGRQRKIAELITPTTLEVRRNKHDLKLVCRKPGYAPATKLVPSKTNPWWIWGNLLLVGGPIGIVVDAITKANNKYPKDVSVSLSPADDKAESSAGTKGS